jgi:hypothetical protein
VLEKPVYTFAAGEIAPGQEQTLHFGYLLPDQGGAVQYAPTLEEHTAQLARGIAGDYDADAIRAFAESFLRPHGLAQPVAPILADEVAALAMLRPARKTHAAGLGPNRPRLAFSRGRRR